MFGTSTCHCRILPISRSNQFAPVYGRGGGRVFEFLEEPEEIQEVEHPVPADNITGQVTFSHVRFGYLKDQPVIKDFSCEVEKGKDGGHRGSRWRRKNNHCQAFDAILRRGWRINYIRRSRFASLTGRICAADLAWCYRILGFFMVRLWKTSVTAV